MRVVTLPPTVDISYDDESGIEIDALDLGGIYFYLYPFFLSLQQETGELIDPQRIACFDAQRLPALARELGRAHEAAGKQGEVFEQHVGRQLSPQRKEIHEPVERSTLLATIETLSAAVARAQRLGHHVYFVGC